MSFKRNKFLFIKKDGNNETIDLFKERIKIMKSGIDGWYMFFNYIEYILPVSICFVLLIYYLDKKNKSKKNAK